jgi:hypothetical protein
VLREGSNSQPMVLFANGLCDYNAPMRHVFLSKFFWRTSRYVAPFCYKLEKLNEGLSYEL